MEIRVQRHANVSKQATLLDGLYVSPLKWHVFGCGLNRFVHEGMNHISNVEVLLKTRNGNVNIVVSTLMRRNDVASTLMRLVFMFCVFMEIYDHKSHELTKKRHNQCTYDRRRDERK